jgi:hypothetical protein
VIGAKGQSGLNFDMGLGKQSPYLGPLGQFEPLIGVLKVGPFSEKIIRFTLIGTERKDLVSGDLGFPHRSSDPIEIGKFINLPLNGPFVFQKENLAGPYRLGNLAEGLAGGLSLGLAGDQNREKENGVHSAALIPWRPLVSIGSFKQFGETQPLILWGCFS